MSDTFDQWMDELEARHLAELTFPEVSRALRALSSAYVERRKKLGDGAALSGNGKRAAFALFYGPLHHLLIAQIVGALPPTARRIPLLLDLGCGTGASGSAWAAACERVPRVVGLDRHPWVLREAGETYRRFGLSATVRRGDITDASWPKGPAGILAAFTINELPDTARDTVLEMLLQRAGGGDSVLVVEPLAGFVAPWWNRWRARVESAGGRADEWRFRVPLPAIVAKLDRAAGLNHREITGRSLWIG